jgi:hypothetical protein
MRADEYRRRQRPTVDVEIAAGVTFKLRRPNLQAQLVGGRMPTYFMSEVGGRWRRTQGQTDPRPEEILAGMSGEETRDWMTFIKTIVLDVAVEPRLTEGEPGETELSIYELEDAHLFAIFNWAMGGAKGAPVETASGEVEVESLRRFHPPGPRESANSPGPDGEAVRAASLADVGLVG